MEPDIVRMYSSSPPPLDEDGEEEDEDDFGEFGGYCCGVSSSLSFSEYDMTSAFDQSCEADSSPPDLHSSTFIQRADQPGKDSAVKESEKITKTQEMPNQDSWLCENDVDCGNKKVEVLKVLPNGPLAPTSQKELMLVLNVEKQSTFELKDFKPSGKDEPSDNPNTDQVGHCLSNGPITICTDKDLEKLTETSTNSTEAVLARAEDSSTETNQAARANGSDNSDHSLRNNISQSNASETRDTLAGNTQYPEVAGENQRNKEKLEIKQMEKDPRFSLGGLPIASGIKIQNVSGDLGDAADTTLTPVVENIPKSDAQFKENVEDCNINNASLEARRSLVVPGRVELEELCLTVVDSPVGIVHGLSANPGIRDVKKIQIGSSIESDEDFGDFRDATQGFPDISQTESMSQEGFADFVTALSDCSSHDEFADADTLKDLKEEEELATEDKDEDNDSSDTNYHEQMCSELPPSDSFADFSSAPFGGENWAEFGQQEEQEVQQESWAAFDEEQQSSTATAPSSDSLQSDNVLCGLSHKLQHLFESTFPLESTSEDSDVQTLQVLLEPQDHAEIREPVAMWRHLLDIHNTHGLKVQWVGSHSNRILLDCLGIYNILFTGQNKQPVIVPMFAAGLGMLEPTKEPVKHLSIFSSSSPGQGRSALCTQEVRARRRDKPGGGPGDLSPPRSVFHACESPHVPLDSDSSSQSSMTILQPPVLHHVWF
ncbi:aftiphilin isoform X2 [Silurus asotus]|uniref:Aftiphilin isoform X2 n=1 Tax=Silurus asotus TaxID=30991 RepID=A0AAD5FMR9_SILAS|nr:aftiphilin isoform X2 [Silurus asotus]